MTRWWGGLALLVFFAACAEADRTIPPADAGSLEALARHQDLEQAHRLVLAGTDEPGRRFLLAGRLVRRDDGRPLVGRRIVLFHTNAEGSYEESVTGDESTARLRGDVASGPGGRFLVSTILPGAYDGSGSGGHIHAFVPGARPEYYDFHFAQYSGAGIRRWARRSGQGVILRLESKGDTLVSVGDLPVGLPLETPGDP